MKTFLIGLIILFLGGTLYSRFIEKLFRPDDRATPAVANNDGVDYVPMKKWKNALINLLNIAGTGPIFGPIQGILFGPIVFINIPIGCVISGATNDYLCSMMSMRNNGAQMPGLVRKFLGSKVYYLYSLYVSLTILLCATVFVYTPGDIICGEFLNLEGVSIWSVLIYGGILVYYLIATIFPIDKIIGKIYPIFGAILLGSAIAILFGIFIKGYSLDEISLAGGFSGLFNQYPLWNVDGNTGAGTPFFPVLFVTIACGITSGFHSTQCTLISRSVSSEKEGRFTFYWTMIAEGFIAMIWAAAAMGRYNAGSLSDSLTVVGEITRDLLGPVGGLIALISVIVLPITSGDTAIRSSRVMFSEIFRIDQKTARSRVCLTLLISLPVIAFLVFAKLRPNGFSVLWRYFAWANQTVAVFTFTVITIYLLAKKGTAKFTYLVSLLPGTFYVYVITAYLFSQKIGFGMAKGVSDIIGICIALTYFVGITVLGKKYSKKHIEE